MNAPTQLIERISAIEKKPSALVPQATTPADLLRIAVAGGADLDKLERLMALQERWEATEARKAFTQAMSDFKSEPLAVFKRQTVDFSSAKGRTHYKHATLSDVTEVVAPAMAKHGLSFRWDVRQEGKTVSVDCVVTHALGHAERVTMSGPLDDTGNKNAIQQAGSTVTYLQRYTLLAVTGLSTQNEDDDGGNGVGAPPEDEALLDSWRAVSLEGEAKLKAYYTQFPPPPAFWARHSASLKAAAHLADKERA